MLKITATASELSNILDAAPGIEWLSLDCFDTLVWRTTHAPADVFADLPFQGGGIDVHKYAEKQAYLEARSADRGEVSLAEIYAQLMPFATEEERAEAVDHELALEASHAFCFKPVRDLMVEAKRRGLKIAIASDMYLREPQLRAHIAGACGEDTLDMVDRVFVSSEYDTTKRKDLFVHILAELGVSPSKILHVGDMLYADQERPSELGINTVLFEQFSPETTQRLRLESTAARLVGRGVSRPVYQLHRPQVSIRTETDPAYVIGHDVLGPILYGLSTWLRSEAEAMQARTGKQPRMLFLMRDGYLPMKAFVEHYPELAGHAAPLELSRFTAHGCSFTDAEAIARYVIPVLNAENLPQICKQLAMTADEKRTLCRMDPASFLRAVTTTYAPRIIERSRAFADRLVAHLGRAGVEQGDAVMLVDIGYQGTVQNVIEPVLRDRMGLEIAGRYMALRQFVPNGSDKRGYLDARHYDNELLTTIWENIGAVEGLFNVTQGSVVDYQEDGEPVREASGRKQLQNARRDVVQRGCIEFVAAQRDQRAVLRRALKEDEHSLRESAMAALVRFLFLPQRQEVDVIGAFDAEKNQGTGDMMRYVDPELASEALRRHGIFYTRNRTRLFLPGELQRHGTHLNLSLLVSRRFGLDLRKADFEVGGLELPVMLIGANGQAATTVEAHPTNEGYYLAHIPVGEGEYVTGIQFGQLWEWVQVDHMNFQLLDDTSFKKLGEGFIAEPVADGMTQMGPGLFRCDPNGFLMVLPPATHLGHLMLSVVFRPIAARTAEVADASAENQAA